MKAVAIPATTTIAGPAIRNHGHGSRYQGFGGRPGEVIARVVMKVPPGFSAGR
jgi:hypothetical protein